MQCTTVARTTWIGSIVRLAPATVHTEDLSSIIASLSLGDLAILSDVLHTMLVNCFGTVAVELIVAVDITKSQYALSAIITHVVRIGTVFVLDSTQ